MAQEPSETKHTVTVTGLRDDADKQKVAQAIARIARDVPLDRILKRLESLPWTLTRSATGKIASRSPSYSKSKGPRSK